MVLTKGDSEVSTLIDELLERKPLDEDTRARIQSVRSSGSEDDALDMLLDSR